MGFLQGRLRHIDWTRTLVQYFNIMSNIDNNFFKEELGKAHNKLSQILAEAKEIFED